MSEYQRAHDEVRAWKPQEHMPGVNGPGPCGCEACKTVSVVAYAIFKTPYIEAIEAEGAFLTMSAAYGWEGPWDNEIEVMTDEEAKELGLGGN